MRIITWFEHHMRWVLITPLGMPVEPEVNRNLAMVSGPTCAWAASTAAVGARSSRSANSVVGRLGIGLRVTSSSSVRRHHRLDGAAVGLAVGREHEARREQVDDEAQLAEVARDQRIGGRDRRVGDADIDGGKPEQRVLEVVAGEDRDRPLGRKLAREQRGADAAHLLEGLRDS